MASHDEIASRWIANAMGWNPRELHPRNSNVWYSGDTIYSYGTHFPMGIVLRDSGRERRPRMVLLNGDSYSPTTTQHQGHARAAAQGSGLPVLIVPFTALNAAGIERESIEPLEIREDRTETFHHEADSNDPRLGAPAEIWNFEAKPGRLERASHRRVVGRGRWPEAELCDDGVWRWTTHRHWLGDSLFRARANGRRRRFLSSFDYQEARPLYFLCELPRSSDACSVEQAYEDLKPQAVKDAEAAGLEVTRQGDMFAIPTNLTTREVKLLTPRRKGRIVKRPPRGLLGTNHTASEVMFCTYGRVYARGLLYHEPGRFRDPDHARRKMGDGRTWHLLIKNTVPRAQPRTRTREAV